MPDAYARALTLKLGDVTTTSIAWTQRTVRNVDLLHQLLQQLQRHDALRLACALVVNRAKALLHELCFCWPCRHVLKQALNLYTACFETFF